MRTIGRAYAALLVVLGVTIFRGWQPVFDLRLPPVGIICGIVVGVIGGLVAIRRAAKVEPSDALRS